MLVARYYSSRTGTFCLADPVAGSANDPQSWNRYPYGRNDPVGMVDPAGKSWLDTSLQALIDVVALVSSMGASAPWAFRHSRQPEGSSALIEERLHFVLHVVEIVFLALTFLGLPERHAGGRDSCPISSHRPGSYSKLSIDLCFQDVDAERRHLEIPSPDGSTILVVESQDAWIVKKDRRIPAAFLVGRSQEEIIWSPDSKALIATLILGASGPAAADFVFVDKSPFPTRPPLTQVIRKDFASGHSGDACWESANVGGLGWLEGGREALFVAEVPPSSGYEDRGGYFDGYVVSVPDGRIVKRYPMRAVIKKWRNLLGPGLKDDIEILRDR